VTESMKFDAPDPTQSEAANPLPRALPIIGSSPDKNLSVTLAEFLSGISEARTYRAGLYYRFRPDALPSVTLDQATWLLLGLDPLRIEDYIPLDPKARADAFRDLQNRLECEIAANQLKPIGRAVAGFTRRFRLKDVANTAQSIGIADPQAGEILDACGRTPDPKAAIPGSPQSRELALRLNAHRAFVAQFGTDAIEVPPKTTRSPRRKDTGARVNRRLAMTSDEYDEGFRKFVATNGSGISLLGASKNMLKQDRRDLNIQVKTGRPRSQPRKP
jgi:hypothetical protein